MKKILLFIGLIVCFAFVNKVQAQCEVSNVKIRLNSTTVVPTGDSCRINFDVSFNLEHNSGNKYAWIHLWKNADYPSLDYKKPPTKAELALALANIGIDFTVSPAVFQPTYSPDPGPKVQTTGTLSIIPGTPDLVTVTGAQVTVIGGCSNLITLKGDVWSSQASSQNAVHCANTGVVVVLNDPTVNGFLFCDIPHKYNVTIGTTSPTTVSGSYNVYRDNGDGVFNAATDFLLPSATNIAWSAATGTPYQSGQQSYAGNNTNPEASRSLWVEVTTVGLFNKTYAFIPNSCAALPVSFKSFTATRNHSIVLLKWETATEQNNSGFYIERSIGGIWEDQVAFVPSQAAGGNSSIDLSYVYTDLNNGKGITEYRLRQVDFDGNAKYSVTRLVRGDGQIGKTIVFPNPSLNGSVSVVFEDATMIRDISLSDMSGRILNRWQGTNTNYIQIDNLTPGMYILKIMVPETGEQSVEKIIVSNR